jgi:hypothetical protein
VPAEFVHFSEPTVKEGDVAPDFTLPSADGNGTITLSQFRGKPLVLIFGSYTCNIFAKDVVEVRKVWEETHENVPYLMVYVREAHAADEWVMKDNQERGLEIPQPQTVEERAAVARRCVADYRLDMPTAVDLIDDSVCKTYSGWPDRIYVLDENGVIVHQSGWGPFDFQPWVARRIVRERFGY